MTHWATRTHLIALWFTFDDTPGNPQALVYTLAETIPKIKEQSVSDTKGVAEPLVDAMADMLAEVGAVTPGDTLKDAYPLNNLLGDS